MRRAAVAALAAGLVGLSVPVPQAAAESTLGGFSAKAIATPIKIEVYEPVIPIPTTPQFELNVAYTKSTASSGPASKARASWLWPGDPVGEGLKTFVEQLGLPPQLGQAGYPVQINAETPSDTPKAADEPFPGTVMRVTTDGDTSVAKAGFNTSGDLENADKKKDETGSGSGIPGLPALPGLSGVRAAEESGTPGLGALAGVVSAGGMSSVSKTTYVGDSVVASGVTRIGELKILGGIITADAIKVVSRTTSTAKSSDSEADVVVGGLAIAGVPFGITKDGVVGAGQGAPIPGLPDDPAEALKLLGVSFKLPTATKSGEGPAGKQTVRGLEVSVDLGVLLNQVDLSVLDGILGQVLNAIPFPPEAATVKSLLGALTQLRPKVVVTLGDILTEAEAAAPISIAPPTGGGETPATSGDGAGTPATGGGVPGGDVPTASAPIDGAPVPTTTTTETPIPATPIVTTGATPGLPELGSIPGMLIIGGLLLASALGWWLQRMGGLIIGGGSACSHGLASGVPDLRKA